MPQIPDMINIMQNPLTNSRPQIVLWKEMHTCYDLSDVSTFIFRYANLKSGREETAAGRLKYEVREVNCWPSHEEGGHLWMINWKRPTLGMMAWRLKSPQSFPLNRSLYSNKTLDHWYSVWFIMIQFYPDMHLFFSEMKVLLQICKLDAKKHDR